MAYTIMSFAEIKKTINSDLSVPLNTLIVNMTDSLKKYMQNNIVGGYQLFTSNGTITTTYTEGGN